MVRIGRDHGKQNKLEGKKDKIPDDSIHKE